MSATTTSTLDPYARTLAIGNAPATQTGTGGQWVNAWSVTGVSAVHKANAGNAAEAWTAVKYTDALSTVLAGGDMSRGDLGVGGQSFASSAVKQEIDGKEALRFNLAEAAQSVTISLSSFFANDDGVGLAESARIRLFDANGNLVGESFAQATGTSGNQLVQVNSAQAFRSVEISAGAQRADGSFSFGGYGNGTGGFGTDSYTKGGAHGSDFLVHSVEFALARPTAAADSYTLKENAAPAIFGSVLANDRDAGNAPLSAVLESGTAHGTLALNADGTFSYQPVAGYSGTDSFSYRASNGKDLSAVTVVTLTIDHVNRAPVAVNDSAVTNEDTAVTGNVLDGRNGGRDTDADGDALAVTNTGTFTTSLGATVKLSANGDFTYDAATSSVLQALAGGASRVDGFDYSISDGHGGTATAHVDVTVQGRDEAGLLPSVEAGAELVHYLHYKGQTVGDTWVKIDGYSVGAQSESATTKGGGAAVGKPVPDEFTLTLGGNRAGTDFTSLLVQGKHLDDVSVVSYVKTATGPQLVQQYALSDAFVTGVSTDANTDGATQTTMSLVYKEIAQGVSPLGGNGLPTKLAEAEWSVTKMTASTTDANVPVAGVNLSQLASTVDSDVPLDSYVRVLDASGREVVPGWVSLSSFGMDYAAVSSYLTGSGAAVGKPAPSEVSIGLGISGLMTELLKKEILGTSLGTVEIEAYAPGGGAKGSPVLVDEYVFKDAFVTSLSSESDAGNEASFVYKSFTHAHVGYDAKGKIDSAASGSVGYDVAQGRLTTAPAAKADALTATLLPSVEAGADLVHYLHYKGQSVPDTWVKIDGYAVGAHSESAITKGSGAAVGKPVPEEFTVTLGGNKAGTDFTALLVQGKHLDDVSVVSYLDTWEGPKLVQQYALSDAFVTGVSTDADADGGTQTTMSLVYKEIAQGVSPLGDNGLPTKLAEAEWSVTKMTTSTVDATVPVTGVNLSQLASTVDSDVPLEYYVRVLDASGREVVPGWVSLSSFGMDYTAVSSYLAGTGAAVGKPVASEVSIGLGINQLMTVLLKNEIMGTSLRTLEIEAYAPAGNANGKPALVDEYVFKDVFVTGLSSDSDAGNEASFVYKSFSHAHVAYEANGKINTAGSGSVGYDVAQGTLTTAPAAKADALTATLLPSVEAGADLVHYLHYKGQTVPDTWVQIDGYSVGAQAESSFTKGGGAAVGKPVPDEFTLTMGGGKASTDFMALLVQGKHLDDVSVVSYVDTWEGLKLVQQYALSDAFVTGVSTDANADGATQTTMSLVYNEIAQGVSPLGANGLPTKLADVEWNVTKMTTSTTDANVPVAGVNLSQLASTVDSGAPLDYYVRVLDASGREVVPGWVALSSFGMDYTAVSSYLTGAGAAVGKPAPSEVTIGLGINQLMTALLKNEIQGTSLKTVEIEAYAPGGGANGKPVLVDEYFFKDVFVTDLSSAGDAGNEASFVYKSFTHAHVAYDERGRIDVNDSGSVGYDVAAGKLIGVPTAHGDMIF